ncbi:hypothetical protein JCM15519_12290 [Fundidesulfovibrio butyratiphilus]
MEVHAKKPVGKLIMYGLASCALYCAVYINEPLLLKYFGRGGVYAALPIASVFLVSWIHGNFAGALWTVLGINAATATKTQARPAPRKDSRPRATVSA